eukprot:4396346-Prymnesium_polylepis.1
MPPVLRMAAAQCGAAFVGIVARRERNGENLGREHVLDRLVCVRARARAVADFPVTYLTYLTPGGS